MSFTGTVKWFNINKGFGFITPDEGGKDMFVHISALQNAGIASVEEGQKVSYDVAKNKGRLSAVNIQFPGNNA